MEATIPYWNVMNSWGTSWGLKGYVWIGFTNSTDTKGICGIAQTNAYPLYASS